jgi:hypothetical protein
MDADAAASQAKAELHVFDKISRRQLSLSENLPRERHSGPEQRNPASYPLQPTSAHEVFNDHGEVGYLHQRRGVIARHQQIDRLSWLLSSQDVGHKPLGASSRQLAICVDNYHSVRRISLEEVPAEGKGVAFAASTGVLPLDHLCARLSR